MSQDIFSRQLWASTRPPHVLDDELDVKWRVVVQKCQQDDDLMCKFVKEKTRWRQTRHKVTSGCVKIVNKRSTQCEICQEKDVSWCRNRRKVTSRRAKSSTRCRLKARICLEKDVLCRRIRRKVTSRRAKIVNKMTTHCTNLSGNRRLLTSN